MARPKGTKYIETPEKMWELFEDYVKHEAKNPMYKIDYVGKDGLKEETPLMTPITFEGFECYLADLGIINDLGDYSKNKDDRYSDYTPIVTRIRNNCFVQNFKGAAIKIFDSNLIARKLGLLEKSESKIDHSIKILSIDPLSDELDNKTE
jgi:hypothetical protein